MYSHLQQPDDVDILKVEHVVVDLGKWRALAFEQCISNDGHHPINEVHQPAERRVESGGRGGRESQEGMIS